MSILDYAIWERINYGQGKWRNFKINHKKKRKACKEVPQLSYYIGWDGKRFAEGKDYRALKENIPEMIDHLLELIEYQDSKRYIANENLASHAPMECD